MTDRELRKLGRVDLLTLLLEQSTILETTRKDLADARKEISQHLETFDRLRDRLNEKDETIRDMNEKYARLCNKLNVKDAEIESLRSALEAAGIESVPVSTQPSTIRQTVFDLKKLFGAAIDAAADQFIAELDSSDVMSGGVSQAEEHSDAVLPAVSAPEVEAPSESDISEDCK